jgi:hypothetical protein
LGGRAFFHSIRDGEYTGYVERCETIASHRIKKRKITESADNKDPKEEAMFHEKKVSG